VFTTEFDTSLRNALRKGEAVEDLFDSAPFIDPVDEILELLKEENAGKPDASAVAQAVPATDEVEDALLRDFKEHIITGDKQNFKEEDSKLPTWIQFAKRTVNEYIKLIVEPSSEATLAKAIQESQIGIQVATGNSTVLIVYDVKQAGEAMCRPQYRHPPLRKQHLKKCVGAVLQARPEARSMQSKTITCSCCSMPVGTAMKRSCSAASCALTTGCCQKSAAPTTYSTRRSPWRVAGKSTEASLIKWSIATR